MPDINLFFKIESAGVSCAAITSHTTLFTLLPHITTTTALFYSMTSLEQFGKEGTQKRWGINPQATVRLLASEN